MATQSFYVRRVFPRKKFCYLMFGNLLLLIFEEERAVARRRDCDGRVNEDEYAIWLPLFGCNAKYIEWGSGAGTNVSGDAVSRGDLRILSGADFSFDPHG
jgi:hypothetical protein